nr:copia protein [Tanacetum cinerariifolium]
MTIIGTKWVFRNKLDENGNVSRNKARLVAQGYNQQEGIDYDETYTLVARLESIRILLAYACALDFKLFQMDVKSAFLNGFIHEEVYVAQPLGFIDFEKPDHVYKLKKPLYGLKQVSKAWPDIMFSVCFCARFQEAPKTSHLEAVKHIFQYIKGTTHLGLWYPNRTNIETKVYANSDHAGDYVDQKSTSGICMFVGCCLTSWFSKKQPALAISTTEAEYVSTEKTRLEMMLDDKNRLDDVDLMLSEAENGRLVEFGHILKIPFEGHVLYTDMWSLDYLVISTPSKSRYKTTPPSPIVIKSLIQTPRQGQVTRTCNKKTIVMVQSCRVKFPELAIDRYILYDRVMHPFAPHYERKTRSDHGTTICRDSNPSSSSTALNHSSSSHHLDGNDDENDEKSSHSNTSSLPQLINSLSNVVLRVFENLPMKVNL